MDLKDLAFMNAEDDEELPTFFNVESFDQEGKDHQGSHPTSSAVGNNAEVEPRQDDGEWERLAEEFQKAQVSHLRELEEQNRSNFQPDVGDFSMYSFLDEDGKSLVFRCYFFHCHYCHFLS